MAKNNRDFSDERLRYLYESARLGSMRAASEFLNMAPSSISRQIAGMEKELGIELIERSRHTVQLTAAGQLAVQYYRDRLSQREALTSSIDDLRGHRQGHIVVAVGQGLVRMPLVRSLSEFVEKFPGSRSPSRMPRPATWQASYETMTRISALRWIRRTIRAFAPEW